MNTARILPVVFDLDCCHRVTLFDFCVDKCGDRNNWEVESWMGVLQCFLPATLFSSMGKTPSLGQKRCWFILI